MKGPRRKGGRSGPVPGLLSRIPASGPWIGCKTPPGVREVTGLPRRGGPQRGPGLRVWRMLVLEAWFRIPPRVKGPGLVRWLISLDCKHPQKGGSESEPSRGRLQPSRRAERALLRKRRSKGAGGWLLFCRRQKKKPEQSGLCSDVRAAFGTAKCLCTKRKGTLLIDPLIPDSFSQY